MTSPARSSHKRHENAPSVRWECPCQSPPVLLATWEADGRVNVKVRDRYWHFDGFGQAHAVCPRCATEHILDLTTPDAGADAVPKPSV